MCGADVHQESNAVINATNAVMAVLQFQNSCLTNETLVRATTALPRPMPYDTKLALSLCGVA
jgi:hypothetical protein